ncbi:MAG: 3'-5' exoribonuclease [Clostridia bacterium]|nr:3'-5' exoribonuclease [Clostridia bacterium]
MKLLDYINEKTNDAYKDFKLVSVIFDENTLECTFKFLYKESMPEDAKATLTSLIKTYINQDSVNVVVKCKRAYIDCDLVRDVIFNFIIRNFNSIGIDFTKDRIEVSISDFISVKIKCTHFQYEYITNNGIEKEIISYANGFFFEQFELSISQDILEKEEVDIIPVINVDLSETKETSLKYNKVANINNFIGEVNGNPIQISSIKSSLEGVEAVGTIKFLQEKSFESKRKDKEGNTIIKTFYSFGLVDKTGRINCVYFPTKADLIKIQSLQEGAVVIVGGDVEEFNDRLSFKVKSIAYCEMVDDVESEEVEVEKQSVNENYVFVKPEPFVEMFQDNLFIEKQEIGKYLMENDVVVFDIETTGLEATRCEILEIGAVKIHQGKITETFETLIKPDSEIPQEITDLTGITEEMVVDAPNIKQVMPDFYKFCYGATIMAYNIDFDYKFINIWGKKQGYIFDNKQIDVLYMARAFVPGLKNFKLSTVCKKLGVSLENAHRAVHDAMATAEVVIKLNTNLD